MDLLRSTSYFSSVRFFRCHSSPAPLRRRCFAVRSSLPFQKHEAKYYKELGAAIDAVQKACRLCVDVKRSLVSSEGRIIEKNDQTPVTVADFGVQALVSLELSRLFPSIPLVAEEDSAFVRSNNLVDSVVSAVSDKASFGDEPLTDADVLEAIDRGGKDAFTFCTKPATYWVLDPIDGTRGFLRGSEALYVVGLALVVEGEIVLGVMGCPNWKDDILYRSVTEVQSSENRTFGSGIIMVSHVGRGTCLYTAELTVTIWDKEISLLPTCCGSLCKYMMVASGRASVFILRTKVQNSIKAWDHAVGIVCVHEAGGKVRDNSLHSLHEMP
ncbi:putative PAP-specific phosphatase, mitochondrial, partial [Carica papaya]|uniref:putative PAP-specific phosphatase, mitochondrial n=1 Tax=Carica papaya TaxID=3649 RepID=UPI000B8D0A35